MFASCFANALVSKGIAVPPETLEDIKDTSLQCLQQMRASTGMEPKASRLPALDLFQHFLQRFSYVRPHSPCLPSKFSRRLHPTLCATELANKFCPKEPNYSFSQGGDDDSAWEFVDDKNPHSPSQEVHLSNESRASHAPLVHKYRTTSTLDRVQHRIGRVKHWMARAKQLELDKRFVQDMRPEVASVLRAKAYVSGKTC